MITISLTRDEMKVVAYAYGYALRAASASQSVEISPDARERLRSMISTAKRQARDQEEVTLENFVAYLLAMMESARMDFEADFLDWRVRRSTVADAPVTESPEMEEVWSSLFADILENPDEVAIALHPYRNAWDSARLKALRGIGNWNASLLRNAILGAEQHRRKVEGGYKQRLVARLQAILLRREKTIDSVEGHRARCPTCSEELNPVQVFCFRCAEVFPNRLPNNGYGALGALSVALQPLGACGLLEGYLPAEGHQGTDACQHYMLGAYPLKGDQMCPICGQLQAPLEQIIAEPPALQDFPETERHLPSIGMQAIVLTLSKARALRIAYNLAIGFPPLRTYSARNLIDLNELEAAEIRKREELQTAFEGLEIAIEDMDEIYRMAGMN